MDEHPDSPWDRSGGPRRPFLLGLRSSTAFIQGVVATAVFTDVFLYSVIVPVIPTALTERAGVAEEDRQMWISILLALYGAAQVTASPLLGWLAGFSKSRQLPLLLGLLALGAATTLLARGTSVWFLVAARILQGLSAAIVWPVGVALLADTVERDRLGRAMTYVNVASTAGALLAPSLGGLVYDKFGYNSVFGMCFALIGLNIGLRLVLIEKRDARRWIIDSESGSSGDSSSARSSVQADEECRLLGDEECQLLPGEEGRVPAAETKQTKLTPFSILAFITSKFPLRLEIPPWIWLLTSPRVIVCLLGCLVHSCLLTTLDSVLPLYVIETFHWGTIKQGLIFLPLWLPSLAAPAIALFSSRYGSRLSATLGLLLSGACYLSLQSITTHSPKDELVLCALLALTGVGLTLTLPPLTADMSAAAAAAEAEAEADRPGAFGPGGATTQAHALYSRASAAGVTVGPLVSGFLKERYGWTVMCRVLAKASFGVAPLVFLCVGGWLGARIKRAVLQGRRAEVAVEGDGGGA